jgi:hypothetical protein
MEHIEEVNDLFHRIRRPGLLSIPKSGIGDKDLFRGVDKDEPVIEFHPADLLIWENMPIKVRLLDVQEWELRFDGAALKCSLLPGDGHIFSLLMTNCSNDSESVEFDLFVTFAVIRFIRTLTFGFAKP